jgi:hypothetical protein
MTESIPSDARRDALSRVQNAARDTADSFLRFERALDRLRRAVTVTGAEESDTFAAVRRGCDNPKRLRAFETIAARMRQMES